MTEKPTQEFKKQLCNFLEETITSVFLEDITHITVILPDADEHNMIEYSEKGKVVEVYLTGEYLYIDEVYTFFKHIFSAGEIAKVRVGFRVDKTSAYSTTWKFLISWN